MEIKRFENMKGAWWKPGDIIIKGTLNKDFEIYKEDLDRYLDAYGDMSNALQAYLSEWISNKDFDWKYVDYQGNEIQEEEIEFYRDVKNYNI